MGLEQSFNWVQVTEVAAMAASRWVGRGDKEAADQAAVSAMRELMNRMPINGRVVIGEGEIDDAPMLYIGEAVGAGGPAVDIAVDPVEGTRIAAFGQDNALAVLAVAESGALLGAPDMYMEKLIVGPAARGVIDLTAPLLDNVNRVAQRLARPVCDMTVAVLDKPRHAAMIQALHEAGVRVCRIPDGDVAAALLACRPDHPVDLVAGIGGAPEGVISAAAVRAMGGDMQARLLLAHQAKGDQPEWRAQAEREMDRCRAMGVQPGAALALHELVRSDRVVFAATGVTAGPLLGGVRSVGQAMMETESLLISGESGSTHTLKSVYDPARQPDWIRRHVD